MTFGRGKITQALIDGCQQQVSVQALRIERKHPLCRLDRVSEVAPLHIERSQVVAHGDGGGIVLEGVLLPLNRRLIVSLLFRQQAPHESIIGLGTGLFRTPFGRLSDSNGGGGTARSRLRQCRLRGHAPLTEKSEPQHPAQTYQDPPRINRNHSPPQAPPLRAVSVTVPNIFRSERSRSTGPSQRGTRRARSPLKHAPVAASNASRPSPDLAEKAMICRGSPKPRVSAASRI